MILAQLRCSLFEFRLNGSGNRLRVETIGNDSKTLQVVQALFKKWDYLTGGEIILHERINSFSGISDFAIQLPKF
jgi:hypothetical protein